MTYLQQPRSPLQTLPGIGLVILLHVGLIYALLNGLGTNFAEKYSPPMVTRILDSVKPLPPPPKPPPPDLVTPKTMYVPLPDVTFPPPPLPSAPVATSHVPAPLAPAPRAAAPAEQPFQASQIIGGDRSPAYPEVYEDSAIPGNVMVDCIIEVDGNPTNCHMVRATGGSAFATETMRWLTGPRHPVYRPAVRDGQAQREEHQWVISFQPPEN